MEGKLLHRIFIGVEIPVVTDPPLNGDFLAREDEQLLMAENSNYIALENN